MAFRGHYSENTLTGNEYAHSGALGRLGTLKCQKQGQRFKMRSERFMATRLCENLGLQ